MLGVFIGSATGQFEISNSNTTKTLHDVFFINENVGIAVGDSGIILRSDDGGLNWITILELDSVEFRKVKFWDDLHGIVVGSDIYTTNNGGIEWIELEIDNDFFFDVELFPNSRAIVSGTPNRLLELNSFGQLLDQIVGDSMDFNISHMSFINDSVGFAHNFEGSVVTSLLKTYDGGSSWELIEIESSEEFTFIEDISFISDNIGFRGGWYNPHLMKTIDGGLNWFQTSNGDSSSQNDFWASIYDFHIKMNQPYSYYACGWYGEIFRSVDGGTTWDKLNSPLPRSISLRGIFFIDDFTGWAVGDNGTIIKTTNGGGLTSTDNFYQEEIDLYPNPFYNRINIKNVEDEKIDRILLYNSSGLLLDDLSTESCLNMNWLLSGIYFLEIQTTKKKYIKKITKL